MAAPKKLQAKKLVAEKHEAENQSLDEAIGKGLTPKKEHSELDQEKNDYALHPKLAKFKSPQGVSKHD